jgi:hypothetical protein
MRKIDQLDKLKTVFKTKSNYNFDEFEVGYTRYLGTGTHLYILVKDYDEQKVIDIGSKTISPRNAKGLNIMVEQMKDAAKSFLIVALDVEMCSIAVYSPMEITNGSMV